MLNELSDFLVEFYHVWFLVDEVLDLLPLLKHDIVVHLLWSTSERINKLAKHSGCQKRLILWLLYPQNVGIQVKLDSRKCFSHFSFDLLFSNCSLNFIQSFLLSSASHSFCIKIWSWSIHISCWQGWTSVEDSHWWLCGAILIICRSFCFHMAFMLCIKSMAYNFLRSLYATFFFAEISIIEQLRSRRTKAISTIWCLKTSSWFTDSTLSERSNWIISSHKLWSFNSRRLKGCSYLHSSWSSCNLWIELIVWLWPHVVWKSCFSL